MRPDLPEENKFYYDLLREKEIGLKGRQYLNDRDIKKSTADFWQMGYSIPHKICPVFPQDNDAKPWLKLWGRITFPIYDQYGKMVSISGRLLEKKNGRPKYDHYPFNARRILFGLYQNKEEIRKQNMAIITEGQIDVISSWQNNLPIVVSTFGAHCSLDHISLLARYTDNIYVLYDQDSAGEVGMFSIEETTKNIAINVHTRLNIFSKGEDLDSWIRKHSGNELIEKLKNTKNDEYKKRLDRCKNY